MVRKFNYAAPNLTDRTVGTFSPVNYGLALFWTRVAYPRHFNAYPESPFNLMRIRIRLLTTVVRIRDHRPSKNACSKLPWHKQHRTITLSNPEYLCTRRPDFEMFQSLYFSLSRKYTFRPRSKPSDMPICIYMSICTPPPPSLPSTILSSKQGEKVNIKTNDYSALKKGWSSQINNT
jgi:hypothetical protein